MPDLEQIVVRALFVGIRVGSLMVFAPFFSNLAIPVRAKAALTVMLTVVLYPVYSPQAVPQNLGSWIAVVSGEVVMGLLLSLTLHFVFEGFRMAGQIIGFQVAFSLANIIDPNTQVDTPVLSTFHQIFALLIFLQFDVHHWIVRGLGKSFEYAPPGTAVASLAATSELLHLAGGMWIIGVQIAAPVLLATMVADVAMGFLAKIAPQLPILFVGISIKSLLAFVVLLGTMAFWPRLLERYFLEAIQSTERLLLLTR
ncbi:MAG: flagellar biosynthetic protein FliR [Acidobacteria bacterium]|nr:flagellar biosynthetic protein FliR [Acidobacteriota bacterium]